MNNVINHFKTITHHRHIVIYHAFKCGILFQGLMHDLSKYSPTEFFAGAKYYKGIKSPNEGEREALGYSKAWMHHKGRNKHHFEYWTDYNIITKEMSPVEMPVKYVVEMFCDRVAASKVYQGKNYSSSHPVEYFTRGKARRKIHPNTSELLENMLKILDEKGEKAAFKYAKSLIKNKKAKNKWFFVKNSLKLQ